MSEQLIIDNYVFNIGTMKSKFFYRDSYFFFVQSKIPIYEFELYGINKKDIHYLKKLMNKECNDMIYREEHLITYRKEHFTVYIENFTEFKRENEGLSDILLTTVILERILL